MHLSKIPGHTEVKSYFSKIIQSGRIPHALMMFGGEGFGKLALALGLAQLLQCQNREGTEACGTCNSCQKAAKYIHPDIHFSFPVIKKDSLKREDTISKHFLKEWRSFLEESPYGNINDWLGHLNATDKKPNINVAECNDIGKNLSLKTYEGKYKIQIIWQADYLGKEGNRLLKLIEEPADDSIILLILNNRNNILNTIRSRCQSLLIPPFSDEAIGEYISEHSDLSAEDQKELTHLADGSMRTTISQLNENQINYSEDLVHWMRTCYKSDPEELTVFIDEINTQGKQNLIKFFQYGLHFFREYQQSLSGVSNENLRLTTTEKDISVKMQKIISLNKIKGIESVLTDSISYIRRNLSVKILLMNASLEIHALLRS